jgi:DNA-binding NarL/FixJ family response regulator
MKSTRLVIVADHRMTAEAIRRELRGARGCEIMGYVDARRSCALPIANARPDVVVLDDPGRRVQTLDRIRALRAATATAKLVLLTPDTDASWLAQAAATGVDTAIGKAGPHASVGMLLREVLAGNIFHAFPAAAAAEERRPSRAELLSPREMQILRLVARGVSNSRVAAELWVTEQTVKFHLSNVYTKLGVANRTEASHYAHVNGLVDTWTAAPIDAEAA